jgi:hypothetical protein
VILGTFGVISGTFGVISGFDPGPVRRICGVHFVALRRVLCVQARCAGSGGVFWK